MSTSVDRRSFLKTATATGVGLMATSSAASSLPSFPGSPNDALVVGVMGLNGRGIVLARALARIPNVTVGYLCDVDAEVLAKSAASLGEIQTAAAKHVADVRRVLDDRTVDAIAIAAPDHWHAPATILALDAGKHVYVEKPCSHNPREGELIVAALTNHPRVVQIGTQQRSSARSIAIVQAIKEGLIGTPYQVRAWYANTRVGIGRGKSLPTPAHLDYELWQGPAPRTPYRDNIIHYNWHWFTHWGTGEINNNGTHEIDIARWVLGVDYPTRVMSCGGRHHFRDDWEFPDTQEATFEFAGGTSIIWQGQSCNGLRTFGRARGVAILGTNGSVVLDRDGYTVYRLDNSVVREDIAAQRTDGTNTTSDDDATQIHLANFIDAIRTGTRLHAPIEEGVKTNLLCHLGNIAQRTGRALRTDPKSGRIVGDAQAMTHWQRAYEPGWTPAT
jgi:predicted dehydrogenase